MSGFFTTAFITFVGLFIAMPILAAYVLECCEPREHKRLYDQRESLLHTLREAYRQHAPPDEPDDIVDGGGGTAVGRATPGG